VRIVVYGAGSVGGFLAARLAKAGRDVAVIARGPHLAAIRARGLTLEAPDETFTVQVQANDDPAAIGPADLVLVTAKTTANPAVAASIGPLLHAGTRVVFAQNGVFWWYGRASIRACRRCREARSEGRLAAAVPPERAMGLVIYSPNEVVEPGRVVCGSSNSRFVLGAPRPDTPLDTVRDALADAGFTLETTADIRAAMWKKLLVNLSSAPLAALTQATSAEIVGDPRPAPSAGG
jgi:2-dehydropantoate 2-reductase